MTIANDVSNLRRRTFMSLPPGTCSWNLYGAKNTPVEPGYVRFDLAREAQPLSGTGIRK